MKLLGTQNAKTVKGEKLGYLTAITYLAPSDASGIINTCANASAGCRAACLFTAGRGRMNSVMQARINKTVFFAKDRLGFLRQLTKELTSFIKSAARKGLTPCIRLNGTSDLPWENIKLDGKSTIDAFPAIQFYDYTKSPARIDKFINGKMPANYHLTFSRSEDTPNDYVENIIERGGNVAVVYANALPAQDFNAEVISGDETDLRFLDKRGVVVGLTAKGDAAKDTSGFVLVA